MTIRELKELGMHIEDTLDGFPETITATRVVTYNVRAILDDLLYADGVGNPTLSDVVAKVREYAGLDFGCVYGHDVDTDCFDLHSDNGEQL